MADIRSFGIGLALLGSGKIFSECDDCNTQLPEPPLVERKTLAGFGTAAYSACLYGSLTKKPWVDPAMKLAAAGHIFLLLYALLVLKKVCPICLMTATGAFIAAASPSQPLPLTSS
jgi:hypothetical protein